MGADADRRARRGDGVNSPFATAFIQNVQAPGLEVRRLFDFVRDDVMEATQRKQRGLLFRRCEIGTGQMIELETGWRDHGASGRVDCIFRIVP
jgi:hypothetical protein